MPNSNDITALEATALLDALRTAANGTVWWLSHITPEHDHCLTVGVRGHLGALTWDEEPGGTWIPANGTNTTHADYFTPDGDHNPQLPGTEVPYELVLEAVTEFIHTGARPRCVAWIQVSDAA
ncbi:Imm1 family immunity protein [Actinokineospora terrae]|uniref:Immunity protein Imm1 n=1 Tax=Actinokineospora terrae TaxID=155974 RepID=A0A1H9XEB7_9PSEU|nr:Imm1 family immunity protein [Actinokineospora terrae]SES44464.1 Immunity protein Imm1 [Actinokineospora terrae]